MALGDGPFFFAAKPTSTGHPSKDCLIHLFCPFFKALLSAPTYKWYPEDDPDTCGFVRNKSTREPVALMSTGSHRAAKNHTSYVHARRDSYEAYDRLLHSHIAQLSTQEVANGTMTHFQKKFLETFLANLIVAVEVPATGGSAMAWSTIEAGVPQGLSQASNFFRRPLQHQQEEQKKNKRAAMEVFYKGQFVDVGHATYGDDIETAFIAPKLSELTDRLTEDNETLESCLKPAGLELQPAKLGDMRM